MNFTYEPTKNLIDEGDYEATIEEIFIRTNPNSGKQSIHVKFRIREDVEQKYKKYCIYDDIYEDKTSPIGFNKKKFFNLLGTQEGVPFKRPDGKIVQFGKGCDFESLESALEFLTGAALQIHIRKAIDDYYNEERNWVYYYNKTKIKPKTLGVGKEAPKLETPAQDLADDDLPF